MDINQLIAHRISALRDAHGWSLDGLAQRSGVSRSTISLIERAATSPTAVVLDKLSLALGVTLGSLFEAEPALTSPPSPLQLAAQQIIWTDPESGYTRRQLSPPGLSPLHLVEIQFPAGQTVHYENLHQELDIAQQVWLISGQMRIQVGALSYLLHAGDCLAMSLKEAITYHNPGQCVAHYLVALIKP
ncbi:helix-turn-helix domain-containing protein [Undibacterium rugosum]|uniref:helix-turn-helix domain-containing protein n=1 Tax=Undibacterium rugosum TaxID=2762291 RepID=UPI001B82A9DD|nr:helix-turn-helix domain-containing protein [Undibacterium rugosum]MBR7779563.1 helix-turn-helix domain-containing protein [Undibacterium rugosum]